MSAIDELSPRRRRWLMARGLLRALLTAVVLVALYYALPLEQESNLSLAMQLIIGLSLLAGMVAWQVRAILRSRFPAIRAAQALAATTALFLLLYASTYLVLSVDDPASFSEPLTRTDSLYFTITVFATVGFGDIAARDDVSRLVVSSQMLLDLVILGLGIQVFVGAVQRARSSKAEKPES